MAGRAEAIIVAGREGEQDNATLLDSGVRL
jgi:hypothetical protein